MFPVVTSRKSKSRKIAGSKKSKSGKLGGWCSFPRGESLYQGSAHYRTASGSDRGQGSSIRYRGLQAEKLADVGECSHPVAIARGCNDSPCHRVN
jgi:hypothetical protein